jgi:predicted nucleic acid-binding protein
MSDGYVLDACALVAFLADEDGADAVSSLLKQAKSGDVAIRMHKINLLEVYYGIYREYGEEYADNKIEMITKLPITLDAELSETVFRKAGYLKSTYRMSLADAIAVAEASVLDCALVTSDHHELDAVERGEKMKFRWIR